MYMKISWADPAHQVSGSKQLPADKNKLTATSV
jgi:hypothetical protein